jgi:hypothetical protein
VFLVELDIHRAHRALGVVDLLDTFLLFLDALVSLAAKRGEGGLDLIDLSSGDFVVIVVSCECKGARRSTLKRKSNSSNHANSSDCLNGQQVTDAICQ